MPDYVNVFGLFHATRRTLYISAGITTAVLILIIGLAVGLSTANFKGSDVLSDVPLIDGHNDLPHNLYMKLNNDLSTFNFANNLTMDSIWGTTACNSCHTDLPRLTSGKIGAQFWAAYVDCKSQYKDAVQLTLRQIDVIKRLIKAYPDNLQLVTAASDIETVWKNGKIASMMGVEGGHSLDSSLAVLRLYYELGVRYVTLTHSCNTPWADGSQVENATVHGLTSFGETMVYEMNRLGMMVDLAHVSHTVMRRVLAITKAPVIFSHSSVFTLCSDKHRNVPDDVLDSVRINNGIVMVNFYSKFVNCDTSRNATIEDVVAHINYIRNRIGVDYVGIGADYDGVEEMPEGLEDVSKYPDLFDRLYENHENEPSWSRSDLEKLAGRNLIRVLLEVESVRDSFSNLPPYQDIITGQELYAAQSSEKMDIPPGECQTAIEWEDIIASTSEATSTTTESVTTDTTVTTESSTNKNTIKGDTF